MKVEILRGINENDADFRIGITRVLRINIENTNKYKKLFFIN